MIRDLLGDSGYWDKWIDFISGRIDEVHIELMQPSGDPQYRPQYVFQLAQKNYEQMLRRYSRGDPVSELSGYFPPLLDTWEESNRLHLNFRSPEELRLRRDWSKNLDHYIVCFWLVGLALALNIPDDQWKRLIALVGNDGEDELLDRIIASRTSGRQIGTKLCHPKPYLRLLKAVNAPQQQQAQLLQDFVQHWYQDLNRPPKPGLSEMTAMYDRPYWYTYGNRNFEGGAYFGRWCVEAVAAVKAFGIDDSLCLGHEHYPGDLLRPDGPSTHPTRDNDSSGLPVSNALPAEQPVRKGWLSRWLRRS